MIIDYKNHIEDEVGPIKGDFNLRAFEITHNQETREIYENTCDKLAVKDYVTNIIGEGYTVPTLATGSDYNQVKRRTDTDTYMLKYNLYSTHNSPVINGRVIDSERLEHPILDLTRKKEEIHYWFRDKRGVFFSEPLFKDVNDYKLFCYKGEIMCLYNAHYKNGFRRMVSFPDLQPYDWCTVEDGSAGEFFRHDKWEELVEITKTLCQPFPLVRVDFIYADGNLYFREFTFTFGGFYAADECQKPLVELMSRIDDSKSATNQRGSNRI